jgi:hypothetical protein
MPYLTQLPVRSKKLRITWQIDLSSLERARPPEAKNPEKGNM